MADESTFISGSGSGTNAASIQPMGDFTNVGQNDYKSGNPNYTDASAGPSNKTPNADPHFMQKKGGKNYAKNKKKREFLWLFENGSDRVWQPGDPEIQYVESDTPKQCGTCQWIGQNGPDGRAPCNVPPSGLSITVDPVKGCCNKWLEDTDSTMEALEEALDEAKQSTKLQTFIFDKDKYSADDAKAWLRKYGKNTDLDSSGPSHRARQADPSKFKDNSFRTIPIKKGVKAVIGKPKSEMDGDQKVCKNCGAKVCTDKATCPACGGKDFNKVPIEAAPRYCRACSNKWGEKDITCSKCGSMEYTSGTPMSSYSLAGP
jgi:RNA polymerase subunit RPABC4/transcription elongation factor Spt4